MILCTGLGNVCRGRDLDVVFERVYGRDWVETVLSDLCEVRSSLNLSLTQQPS